MRYAVIDIGTNTTRLLVRDDLTPREDILREVAITRLGNGLENTGELSIESMRITKDCVIKYVNKAIELGVEQNSINIFATAASRNSTNGKDFIESLEKETGVVSQIISGEVEGTCAFQGALSGLSNPAPRIVVFDIGGGSTEFALSTQSDVYACEEVVSIPIGSVRITQRHLLSDPPAPEELSNAIGDITEYLKEVHTKIPDLGYVNKWVGVAATATTTAAVEIGLPEFDAKKIHEFVLTREMAEDVFRTLATESTEDRKHNPGLEPERAEVIVGGVAIIVSIMRYFDLASITVSCTDLLDGLWLKVVTEK